MRRIIYFNILFFLSLSYISCDLVTEPERIINEKAYPPEVHNISFSELQPGQHVDGKIRIKYNPVDIDYEIDHVRLYIDEYNNWSAAEAPYIFEFDSRDYSEGLHSIKLYIYSTEKNETGLGNLLYLPKTIFENSLFFDRTQPLPITVTSESVNQGKAVNLQWSESTNANFVAYLIYRSYRNEDFEILDTIYSRSQNSFFDSTLIPISGLKIRYNVIVSTDRNFQYKSSNIIEHISGEVINYNNFDFGSVGPIANSSLSEIYFLGDQKILAFSLINKSLVKELDLGTISNGPMFLRMTVDQSGSKIYIFQTTNNNLYIIDAKTFQLKKKLLLAIPIVDIEGLPEILSINDNNIIVKTSKYIRLIDTESNIVLTELRADENEEFISMAVDHYSSKLIVSEEFDSLSVKRTRLTFRNLNSHDFNVIAQRIMLDKVNKIVINDEAQRVICFSYSGYGSFYVLDLNSLELLKNINGGTERMLDVITYDNKIYASYQSFISFPKFGIDVIKITKYDIYNFKNEQDLLLNNAGYFPVALNNKIIVSSFYPTVLGHVIFI